MTHQTAQRVTITIPAEIVPFLEKYQQQAQVSRSEAFLHGLHALQEKTLAEQYAELARERDPEDHLFLMGNTDGLEASDGSEWL